MKKMKTVFEMIYDHGKPTMGEVRPECEWVFTEPDVKATVKYDGAATAIIDGKFYARFDAKPGRKIPEKAIPCDDQPDPITGHWPHWVLIENQPEYKWYRNAYDNYLKNHELKDATYEAIGPHFQKNPQHLDEDALIEHGATVINAESSLNDLNLFFITPLTKKNLKRYLYEHPEMEGIVFYGKDGKRAKLRQKDFKFKWPKD